MTATIAELLTTIATFEGLSPDALERIARCCTLREYDCEQTVIAYQERSTTVFFLAKGAARATMFTQQGREISYQDLGPGDMFGELSAIDQMPRSTAVVTKQPSSLLVMSGDDYLKMMALYPEIAQATLQKMAGVVRFLCDRVYNFGALDVSSRVRAELCRLALTSGVEIAGKSEIIEITNMPKHQDLANRLATHREAVSRELSALEKEGLIKKGRGSLKVLDLKTLQNSIDG